MVLYSLIVLSFSFLCFFFASGASHKVDVNVADSAFRTTFENLNNIGHFIDE